MFYFKEGMIVKMGKVRIVADSTCDLNEKLAKEYDVTIIPLCVILGDDSFYDGEEITPEKMYEWADANKTTPKTAAVTMEKSQEILKPMMDAGDDIIFFGISEQMSTTCQVIRIVADENEYKRLFVIDSMNLSTGIGLQVLRACRLRDEGLGAEEIVERINAARDKVRASFIVDTLTYLARGGRCSSVTALLGNALHLHPEIVVENGAMRVDRKYRGKLSGVLLKYAKDREEEILTADENCIFITHSGLPEETVNAVRDYLVNLGYFKEVYITRAGGVISSHCGPGTLGVLYYVK